MTNVFDARLNRRGLVAGAGMLGLSLSRARAQGTPVASPVTSEVADELVIDLNGPPDHLDPALAYSVRDWSIVHSVYDALIDFSDEGTLVPLAAEEFSTDDAMTFHVKLREGLTFHDGTTVTSAAIGRTVAHIQEMDSQISDLFLGITEVREIDDLRADIICEQPSAWLPAQIAVWLVLYPEGSTPETLEVSPVGTGPYMFESQDPGNSVTLVRNPDYMPGSPKGRAMAERVTYRFVPESATRVADLTTDTAQIVSAIPLDQLDAIEDAGHTVVTTPILGTTFIRIATDTEPFDDPRVRQALNYGVDVQEIADAIVGPNARRLASVFPDARGLGFDESLEPFPYDPNRARELLAEADLADGFDGEIEVVPSSRTDVVEAVVAQLKEVGIRLSIVTTELAAFNEAWPDETAPALRYASWRPMYDPHSFLSLIVDSDGFLSRFDNPDVDELIRSAATEPDNTKRNELYQQLGALLQEEPVGIYLWNATANYGVQDEFMDWTPRGDQYIVPTSTTGGHA